MVVFIHTHTQTYVHTDALDFIEAFISPHFKKKAIDANTAPHNCLLTYPCLSHLPAFDLGMVAALWPFLSFRTDGRGVMSNSRSF